MATTAAKNYNDVEGMTKRQRLWDSLNYSYGNKGEKISQEYDKARATADRQMLSRGMQRSSYGAQTLANIDKQKIDALNDNQSAMIADYETRLQDIEAQELAQSNWERQFAESQRQFNENQAFQRNENALNRAFQTSEREAQQKWQAGENAINRAENRYQFETNLNYNRERAAAQDAQWEKNYNEQLRQFNEQMEYQRQRANVSDAQWAKTYDEERRKFDQQMAYQRERANVSDLQWEKNYNEQLRQFNEQMAYQRERSNVSDSQWEKTYAEERRKFDEQMALSRDQFDWQKSQASSSASGGGGGSYTPSSKPASTTPAAGTTNSDRKFLDTFGLGTDARSTVSSGDSFYADHQRRKASLANDFEKLKNSLASGGGRGGSYSSPSTTPATTTPAAGTTNTRGTVSSGDSFYADHQRRKASLANDFEKLRNSLKK